MYTATRNRVSDDRCADCIRKDHEFGRTSGCRSRGRGRQAPARHHRRGQRRPCGRSPASDFTAMEINLFWKACLSIENTLNGNRPG